MKPFAELGRCSGTKPDKKSEIRYGHDRPDMLHTCSGHAHMRIYGNKDRGLSAEPHSFTKRAQRRDNCSRHRFQSQTVAKPIQVNPAMRHDAISRRGPKVRVERLRGRRKMRPRILSMFHLQSPTVRSDFAFPYDTSARGKANRIIFFARLLAYHGSYRTLLFQSCRLYCY